MPNPLNNVAVPDDYTDACTILNIYGGRGGTFDVRNQPYFYQLQYGRLGDSYWTEEASQQPGSGQIEPDAIGVRFRNQVAGQAGIVDAKIAPPGQPLLTLTSAGSIAATVLGGIVNGNGTIASGSGFTVVRNSAGNYTITFNPALATTPVVLAQQIQADTAQLTQVTAVSTTQASVGTFSGGVATDRQFEFLASAT